MCCVYESPTVSPEWSEASRGSASDPLLDMHVQCGAQYPITFLRRNNNKERESKTWETNRYSIRVNVRFFGLRRRSCSRGDDVQITHCMNGEEIDSQVGRKTAHSGSLPY